MLRSSSYSPRWALLALLARLSRLGVPVAVTASVIASPALVRAAEADRIVLVVDGSISGIADEALRAAIAAELGVDVALAGPGIEGRGTVRVRLEAGRATIVFTTPPSEGARAVERTIELPAKVDVAIETIALLVGNLVRNEAAALIAQLSVKVEVKTDAQPAPAPPASPEPAPPESVPPPSPVPPPSSAAPPVPPPLARTREGASVAGSPCRAPLGPIPWAVDFAPYLGTSTVPAGRESVRFVSFGTVGTIGAGVRGVQLTGAVGVTTGAVCGATVAGAVDVIAGPLHGLQIAGAVALAGGVKGAQIAGASAFATDVSGAQIAGAVAVARDVVGVQIAPIPVARDVNGAQIGVVNVARDTKGVQIGLVNVARDSEVSIGLFNFVTNGPTHFDAFGTESGLLAATVVHGSRRIHNVYGIGGRVGPAGTRGAVVLGIGGRLVSTDGFDLELDAIQWGMRRDFVGTNRWSLLSQVRLLAAVRVVDGISILAGPAWNVLSTNDPEEKTQAPLGSVLLEHNSEWTTRGWPGVVLGLRAF